LGLLLVRDFVTQHGGTIAVESEPGIGTEFRFTIPNQHTQPV
jgi:two-component system, sensor histidine kinase and response regulator